MMNLGVSTIFTRQLLRRIASFFPLMDLRCWIMVHCLLSHCRPLTDRSRALRSRSHRRSPLLTMLPSSQEIPLAPEQKTAQSREHCPPPTTKDSPITLIFRLNQGTIRQMERHRSTLKPEIGLTSPPPTSMVLIPSRSRLPMTSEAPPRRLSRWRSLQLMILPWFQVTPLALEQKTPQSPELSQPSTWKASPITLIFRLNQGTIRQMERRPSMLKLELGLTSPTPTTTVPIRLRSPSPMI